MILGLVLLATATAATPAPAPAPQRTAGAELQRLLARPLVPVDARLTVDRRTEELVRESGSIASEKKADGTMERVPLWLVRPAVPKSRRLPVVIVLHGTGGNKEAQRPWLERLAAQGIIGVAIDARYHGERSGGFPGATAYNIAIIEAWRWKPSAGGGRQEHPLYYDTVWDLWRLVDYLASRPDVDDARIGMLGFSMGGIQTWLAAAADPRIRVIVPAISVQSFGWSLEHHRWQARARTVQSAHDAAAKDLGEPGVNARVFRSLWTKLVPGILDRFDGPAMLPLLAPRPLLILSGELDPNCPLEGARLAIRAAESAYRTAGATDKLQVDISPGTAHKVTDAQHAAALAFLVRWLRP